MNKKSMRLRRAARTRAKLAELKAVRLSVHRSNLHIYAQIFSGCGTAELVGKLIAERAKAQGIESVSFDRSGFHYHGRIKALAEAAREGGLKF